MTGPATPGSGHASRLISRRMGEVYVLLHMECELKCKVCPYWGQRGACRDRRFRDQHFRSFDLNRLKGFIDEVLPYQPRTVTLSGGEPLLTEDWLEIGRHIKSRGLQLSLSTNALHVPRYLDEIMRHVDSIHVSLGGTKDIIREVRSADFGFDEVVDSLALIDKTKRASGRRRPSLRIIYVVSDLSYRKLTEFYELFQSRGIHIDSFYFQHVVYIDADSLREQQAVMAERGFDSRLWQGYLYEPGPMDLDVLRAQMAAVSRFDNVAFSPRLSAEEIALYYAPQTKRQIAPRGRCQGPWTQVDLYPNGDVMVCPDYVLGNIYRQSVDEIYNGPVAQELRRHILDHGGFPGCTGCFYYYVSQEDPAPGPGEAPDER